MAQSFRPADIICSLVLLTVSPTMAAQEQQTLTPLSGSVLEYSYQRDQCGKKGNPAIFGPCPTGPLPADTNDNANDFIFADTAATSTPAGQRLGAPGPEDSGN